MRRVIFLLYDGMESLDAVGPYDVFSMANVSASSGLFQLVTAADEAGSVTCLGGLQMIAQASLRDMTLGAQDVLVVPGGSPAIVQGFSGQYPNTIQWLRTECPSAGVVASVCFGALILAQADLLDAQRVTTHHMALATLAGLAPQAVVIPGARYVDNRPRNLMASAGVSSAIDLAFHVLQTLEGDQLAQETMRIMEYNPTRNFAA